MGIERMTEGGARSRLRFPALLLAAVSLLFAAWVGFVRLGWPLQMARPALLASHGPLMISGFLGTVIGVERAVATRKRAAYFPPLLTGLGAAALIAGLPPLAGRVLIALGSVGLVVLFGIIVRQHAALYTVTMALGALCWLVGNGLWMAGLPVSRVVLWWAAFLILTIAGERLELSRVLRPTPTAQRLFFGALALFVGGLLVSIPLPDAGTRVAGLGMAALALWLLRYDVARRTVHRAGLTRFIAVCLLLGYGWLAVGGLLGAAVGWQSGGFLYDALLHAIFLGFVFSVIFGHAPIIFPAVLGVEMHYTPAYYIHLALLNVSLLVRIVSDLARWAPGRRWGGLINIITLLLWMAVSAASVRRGKNEKPANR